MSGPIDAKAVLVDCLPPNPANYKSDFQCMTVAIKRLEAIRGALAQEIADHELDRTRAEALERWGEAAEQALVYAATVTDNPMVDKVCMDRAIEWADITLVRSPEEDDRPERSTYP